MATIDNNLVKIIVFEHDDEGSLSLCALLLKVNYVQLNKAPQCQVVHLFDHDQLLKLAALWILNRLILKIYLAQSQIKVKFELPVVGQARQSYS